MSQQSVTDYLTCAGNPTNDDVKNDVAVSEREAFGITFSFDKMIVVQSSNPNTIGV